MIHENIQIGSFLSRPVDSLTTRIGVKTFLSFQAIVLTGHAGLPVANICYVGERENEKQADFEKRVRTTMRALHVGGNAIKKGGLLDLAKEYLDAQDKLGEFTAATGRDWHAANDRVEAAANSLRAILAKIEEEGGK